MITTEVLLAEGKTKQILAIPGNDHEVVVRSKDDLTAGDGVKHDTFPGKAVIANTTTCNVFRLLEACGIPLAFRRQLDETSFLALKTQMIELEVVVRREAHGSKLKREPNLKKGHLFPKLQVEFYLKTKDRQWKGQPIPKDDPYIQVNRQGQAELF